MKFQGIEHLCGELDIIVGGKGDQVQVELDVAHNSRVSQGDRYVAPGQDCLTILRVIDTEFPASYDPLTARRTQAMREGVVGPPADRPAQETYQRKVVTMQVEGELFEDGRRTTGAHRLPERLTPVWPITPDQLAHFSSAPDGNLALGLLQTSAGPVNQVAWLKHTCAGDRMVAFGVPGSGKSQLVRGLLAQQLIPPLPSFGLPAGCLVLDRAGEYVEDSRSQDDYPIYGLTHHPAAPRHLVVVSKRPPFAAWAKQGKIKAALKLQFNLTDIAPIDLVDFYPAFSPTQRALLRDYAYDPQLYPKLLSETKLGYTDKSHWFRDFPGLFELREKGKKLLKNFEEEAEAGDELSLAQLEALEGHLGGAKPLVLERIIMALKRFAQNPLLGGQHRGPDILAVPSCLAQVMAYLAQGHTVVVDLKGVDDDNYTLIAALFARRLLNENKRQPDAKHLRVGLVLEEAHNILAESELTKGGGQGSVFVELAREGRKLKLGFVLVTQQPDPGSIAPEIAATLDTVMAFQMPPDNASYLSRLKRIFAQFEYTLTNARPFEGVAVNQGRATWFMAGPVTPPYMQACAGQRLEGYLAGLAPAASVVAAPVEASLPAEDRLTRLLRERNQEFQAHIAAMQQAWREE